MGNTLESLIEQTIGVAARGDPTTQRQLDRRTGDGWVARTTNHDYADAQDRNNPVTLLATESSGAFSPTLELSLRALDRESRAPGALDNTRYGESRASPTRFYPHHAATISHAIVSADALTVRLAAASLSAALTTGVCGPASA